MSLQPDRRPVVARDPSKRKELHGDGCSRSHVSVASRARAGEPGALGEGTTQASDRFGIAQRSRSDRPMPRRSGGHEGARAPPEPAAVGPGSMLAFSARSGCLGRATRRSAHRETTPGPDPCDGLGETFASPWRLCSSAMKPDRKASSETPRLQRHKARKLRRAAGAEPDEPMSVDAWSAFWGATNTPRARLAHRFLKLLPQSPRCGICPSSQRLARSQASARTAFASWGSIRRSRAIPSRPPCTRARRLRRFRQSHLSSSSATCFRSRPWASLAFWSSVSAAAARCRCRGRANPGDGDHP